MIQIRKSADRGHFDHGWLNTYHTFSFGRYVDRDHMGFRSLRVINDDVVAPGQGFGEHPHEDMEILTYIISGQLAHKDSTGTAEVIRPGDVQYMSAGTGIRHSEFNASTTDPVHLIQIWILPDRVGHTPAYGQKHFPVEQRRNRLRLVASPDGADGSITINQDARVYAGLLSAGSTIEHPIAAGRAAWAHLIKGSVAVNGLVLSPGDAAAIEAEPAARIVAENNAELLVFDVK
ncbi:MAG: pirin family protein [Phycisphaeraceae bacterium]|nr:pirin family protein [Phycisphaeraceae bacterium]